MRCEDLQLNLSAYLDDDVSESLRRACETHFAECPVCRTELSCARRIVRDLAHTPAPSVPSNLVEAINARIGTERLALEHLERENAQRLVSQVRRRYAPRLMPYTVGALATLMLFFGLIVTLRPNFFASLLVEQVSAIENANAATATYDINQPVSIQTYVASRAPFNTDSPSLNPMGALASLSLNEAMTSDDNMIVVADVYSNGQASLAEVINPPRNRQLLSEVESALRHQPAFVPAALDERPRTMRVVFMFQTMEVRDKADVPHS